MAATRALTQAAASRPLQLCAVALRRLRWLVILGWLALAVLAHSFLPSIKEAGNGSLGSLVPQNSDAIKAEKVSKTRFGFPLLSRTLIVQRDPEGLSAGKQLDTVRLAAALTRGRVPGYSRIKGALPVTNALGAPPFSRERSTTAITFLFFDPGANAYVRTSEADRLVKRHVAPPSTKGIAGVTGLAPAQVERTNIVEQRLRWIELGSVLLVALAVGLRFRAVGAPLATLVAMGIAFMIASRSVAWIGQRAGLSVPQEVEPVIVVLVFGVVTDYAIFFLSRFRALAAGGLPRLEAAERSTAQLIPIIFTAGITVVAATSALLVARLDFFRVFGPGLAVSVLVAMVVAITFVPAVLATFGGALFWPRRPGRELSQEAAAEEAELGERRPRRSNAVRFATGRPWWTVLGVLLVLGLCASGLRHLTLSNPIVRGLPSGSPPRQAYEAAAKGFAPGILSPTVMVVSQPGVARRRHALARLQALVARQPGLALVLGPAQQPVKGITLGATRSSSGDAARYFIVLDSDPLGARAISRLRTIEQRLPQLLRRAGLPGAHASFAGDTALSAETIDKTVGDLARITPAALLAIFLVLAIYLRALVAPLYLVVASVLALAASLGVATYVFQGLLGYQGLTYFVPFGAAVLLISLGSDYNVFLIGRVWQEAQRRPLREAVPVAVTLASKPITLAGIVLAGSFALAALAPLRAFYEIALIMAVGLLIDALLIRTLLVPGLVMIVGERSGWPGKQLARREERRRADGVGEVGATT